MVLRLREAGVLVSAGKAYHGPENDKGWMRVGFSIRDADLKEAIRRMVAVFAEQKGFDRKDSLFNPLKRPLVESGEEEKSVKRVQTSPPVQV